MQNLDQLRAAHAIKEAPKTDKASAAKLPAMILTNGLLGAIAFAAEAEKPKRNSLKTAVTSISLHLAQPALGIPELHGVATPEALATRLAGGSALTLQRATSEALAYLSYLKRYAPKKDSAARDAI